MTADILENRSKIREAVRILTDFERLGRVESYDALPNGGFEHSAFMLFTKALEEMLRSVRGTNVQG